MRVKFALAAVAAMLMTSAANAASVSVTNASFDATNLAPGTYQGDNVGSDGVFGPNYLSGWSGAGDSGAQNFGNPSYFQPADGPNVAYVNGGPIYQDLGALLSNTTYTLTVAAGNQPGFGLGSTGSISFIGGSNLGGTLLSSTNFSNQPSGLTSDYTTSFTTGSSVSGDLTVGLARTSGDQILFDNVRVSAVSAAPEPAAWALMMLAIGMIGSSLRMRRRSSAVSA